MPENNYNYRARVEALLQAIYSDSENIPIKQNQISKLFKISLKYIDAVLLQLTTVQLNHHATTIENRQELARLDENRTKVHDSLIAQISAVNRLCDQYEVAHIYSGGEDRREKGDFALDLISEYFTSR